MQKQTPKRLLCCFLVFSISILFQGFSFQNTGAVHAADLAEQGAIDNDSRSLVLETPFSIFLPLVIKEGAQSSSVQPLTAGLWHTCVLVDGGGVKCWGLNNQGQLGNNTLTNSNQPVDVSGLSNGVSAITAGDFHTCALLSSGQVKCWGNGQKVPLDVTGLSGVSAIAAGGYHTCALLTGGNVKCWGKNDSGQLGNGTTTDSTTPVDVTGLSNVSAITAGGIHSCALLVNNTVQCWGYNFYGQLGNGTNVSSSIPVTVSGLSEINAITAGQSHTCALRTDGGLNCWGYNAYGQVGDGTLLLRIAPVLVGGLFVEVSAVSAGLFHTCALLTDGVINCWGYNIFGQLGNGTINNSNTPVNVSGLATSQVSEIAAGGTHTCARLSDGKVKCWGNNDSGQLGNGTNTNSNLPVDVVGLP